jgi:hypothetical protein
MALDLEMAHDKRALASGGTPIDSSRVVAQSERLKRLEFRTRASMSRPLLLIEKANLGADVLLKALPRGKSLREHLNRTRAIECLLAF